MDFNFIETIFVISLGITYVLMILSAYYFKKRIQTMEKNSDDMFEIIQNIFKMINLVHSINKI
jgi:uncharacterized membrane protein